MKVRKFRHKYLRQYIKSNKITDSIIKSALYGAMFDFPKKVNKGLLFSKNDKHKNYLLKMFLKIAIVGKSRNTLKLLKET